MSFVTKALVSLKESLSNTDDGCDGDDNDSNHHAGKTEIKHFRLRDRKNIFFPETSVSRSIRQSTTGVSIIFYYKVTPHLVDGIILTSEDRLSYYIETLALFASSNLSKNRISQKIAERSSTHFVMSIDDNNPSLWTHFNNSNDVEDIRGRKKDQWELNETEERVRSLSKTIVGIDECLGENIIFFLGEVLKRCSKKDCNSSCVKGEKIILDHCYQTEYKNVVSSKFEASGFPMALPTFQIFGDSSRPSNIFDERRLFGSLFHSRGSRDFDYNKLDFKISLPKVMGSFDITQRNISTDDNESNIIEDPLAMHLRRNAESKRNSTRWPSQNIDEYFSYLKIASRTLNIQRTENKDDSTEYFQSFHACKDSWLPYVRRVSENGFEDGFCRACLHCLSAMHACPSTMFQVDDSTLTVILHPSLLQHHPSVTHSYLSVMLEKFTRAGTQYLCIEKELSENVLLDELQPKGSRPIYQAFRRAVFDWIELYRMTVESMRKAYTKNEPIERKSGRLSLLSLIHETTTLRYEIQLLYSIVRDVMSPNRDKSINILDILHNKCVEFQGFANPVSITQDEDVDIKLQQYPSFVCKRFPYITDYGDIGIHMINDLMERSFVALLQNLKNWLYGHHLDETNLLCLNKLATHLFVPYSIPLFLVNFEASLCRVKHLLGFIHVLNFDAYQKIAMNPLILCFSVNLATIDGYCKICMEKLDSCSNVGLDKPCRKRKSMMASPEHENNKIHLVSDRIKRHSTNRNPEVFFKKDKIKLGKHKPSTENVEFRSFAKEEAKSESKTMHEHKEINTFSDFFSCGFDDDPDFKEFIENKRINLDCESRLSCDRNESRIFYPDKIDGFQSRPFEVRSDHFVKACHIWNPDFPGPPFYKHENINSKTFVQSSIQENNKTKNVSIEFALECCLLKPMRDYVIILEKIALQCLLGTSLYEHIDFLLMTMLGWGDYLQIFLICIREQCGDFQVQKNNKTVYNKIVASSIVENAHRKSMFAVGLNVEEHPHFFRLKYKIDVKVTPALIPTASNYIRLINFTPHYVLPSPFSLIVDRSAMEKYCKLQKFLIRHMDAELTFNQLWFLFTAWNNTKNFKIGNDIPHWLHLLRQKIQYFISTMTHYIKLKLLSSHQDISKMEKNKFTCSLMNVNDLYLWHQARIDWLYNVFFQHPLDERIKQVLDRLYAHVTLIGTAIYQYNYMSQRKLQTKRELSYILVQARGFSATLVDLKNMLDQNRCGERSVVSLSCFELFYTLFWDDA